MCTQQLRQSDRQRAHGRAHQRGGPGAAGADDAAKVVLRLQEVGQGLRHRRHRAGAFARAYRHCAVPGHRGRADIGTAGLVGRGRHVHRDHAHALRPDLVAQEQQFFGLGVEGADHVGRALCGGVVHRGLRVQNVTRLYNSTWALIATSVGSRSMLLAP